MREWVVWSFTRCIWKSSLAKVLLRSQKLTDSNHSPKENLFAKCYLPILGDEGWVREMDCLQKNHFKILPDAGWDPQSQKTERNWGCQHAGSHWVREKGASPAPNSLCSAVTACWGLLRSEVALKNTPLVLLVRINPSHFAPYVAEESFLWGDTEAPKSEEKLWATSVPPEPWFACT